MGASDLSEDQLKMEANYRNKNRGYQQLRVWQDAIDFYVLSCRVFRAFPYELKRVASQAIASSDSTHRNIAEGYCRRSVREYLYFLNVGLGSLGESVSGLFAYRQAEQLSKLQFDELNDLAFKLENGLLKLVESLERKQETGEWIDSLIIKESNAAYGSTTEPPPQHSITPPLHSPVPPP
jgi:four helix bundle protein